MAGESEEVKFSLGGRCEQRPWLVLKMPVARQAKHETCVRGMAMVQYSTPTQCWCSNSELADGTVRCRLFPRLFSQGSGSLARRAAHRRSSLFWPARIVSPRTENKNRISHENESDPRWPIVSSRIDLVGARPLPGSSLELREAVHDYNKLHKKSKMR